MIRLDNIRSCSDAAEREQAESGPSRVSARSLHEIAKDSQTDAGRLLGVELHARDVPALDDRGERLTVLGDRHGVGGDWRDVAVREIDLRLAAHARGNPRVAPDRQRVPTDVRHLHATVPLKAGITIDVVCRVVRGTGTERAKADAAAFESAQSEQLRRLLACFE